MLPIRTSRRAYPNIGIDSYPNSMRSAVEQPSRHALTLQSDPTFVTGWGAGNIVSDPQRKSPVEDLDGARIRHVASQTENRSESRRARSLRPGLLCSDVPPNADAERARRSGAATWLDRARRLCRLERQRRRSRRKEIGDDLARTEDRKMKRSNCSNRSSRSTPTLILPRVCGGGNKSEGSNLRDRRSEAIERSAAVERNEVIERLERNDEVKSCLTIARKKF